MGLSVPAVTLAGLLLATCRAAGFVLLERPDAADAPVALLGYGESSDGYHMSAPHPDGAGVRLA